MRRALPLLGLALACAFAASARQIGFGVDAFNRVVPASASHAAVFSPLSFEIDCIAFAEAVDPIQRGLFTQTLHVTDEVAAEYGPLARAPFERPETNGYHLAWAHAFIVEEPRRVSSSFRLTVQDLYGFEVCGARRARGIEAWVQTRLAGSFDDWRLPSVPPAGAYALHDLVTLTATSLATNGFKRVLPAYTTYKLPLEGRLDFYALVPKEGGTVASVRPKLTSATIREILAFSASVVDPPVPVRVAPPAIEIVSTNELAGAFSYFRFPTTSLKPFAKAGRPASLTQTVRFRLKTPSAPAPDAETLKGPFLFFIHDPAANAMPVAGVFPGKGNPS